MVQLSSFYIKCNNVEKVMHYVNKCYGDDYKALECKKDVIRTTYDINIPYDRHQKIFKTLYQSLIRIENLNFISKNEFYNDDLEIHEHVIVHNQHSQRFIQKEEYTTGLNETKYLFGKIVSGTIEEEEFDEYSWDLEEVMCPECGEYIKKHMDVPFSYCPFCMHLEEFEVEETIEEEVKAKWKEYDFEIPLGIDLPSTPISSGKDWISDCEEDSVFGLNPIYYESKNQYNAALRLCRICAGWYRYDTDEEKERQLECYREVLKAKKGEPMWYFDIWQNSFDFLAAFKDNNKEYQGKFLEVTELWDLFSRLQQRSYIKKAECFDWMIEFFGDSLRFEGRYKMSDTYVQNYYDYHMESILYLFPHQIDALTKSVAKISSHSCSALSRSAAGLIRMGKRDLGLSLYKKIFAMVWGDKSSTVDDKKQVVDYFIERLAMGYENEEYIDEEIATLLEKQCSRYSDGAWSSKIRMNLGRNKH